MWSTKATQVWDPSIGVVLSGAEGRFLGAAGGRGGGRRQWQFRYGSLAWGVASATWSRVTLVVSTRIVQMWNPNMCVS